MKLILTIVVALVTESLAPKAHAGWPFSSSCRTYRPQCYQQPVQYYGSNQCYQQYRPTYYPPQQCYSQPRYYQPSCQQQYRPPTVVYVYHPPVFTTTTQVIWQSRPTQPSCQNGRCSTRR